jgi:hypothetical protein
MQIPDRSTVPTFHYTPAPPLPPPAPNFVDELRKGCVPCPFSFVPFSSLGYVPRSNLRRNVVPRSASVVPFAPLRYVPNLRSARFHRKPPFCPLPAPACPFKGGPFALKGFFPRVIWVKGYIPDLMLGNIEVKLYFYLGFI